MRGSVPVSEFKASDGTIYTELVHCQDLRTFVCSDCAAPIYLTGHGWRAPDGIGVRCDACTVARATRAASDPKAPPEVRDQLKQMFGPNRALSARAKEAIITRRRAHESLREIAGDYQVSIYEIRRILREAHVS